MKRLDTLPTFSLDLLKQLDVLFPARCIGAAETPTDAHRYAGKRELIDYLLFLSRVNTDVEAAMNNGVLHVQGLSTQNAEAEAD